MSATLVDFVAVSGLRLEDVIVAKLEGVLQGVAMNLPTDYLEFVPKGFTESSPPRKTMVLVSMINLSVVIRTSDKRPSERVLLIQSVPFGIPLRFNLTQTPITISEISPSCFKSCVR